MKKKIEVRQRDIKDCGVCCLLSIMRYFDGGVPIETLRIDTNTTTKGVTAYNLVVAAKKYNINLVGKRLEKISNDLVLPAICHLETKRGYNHFVVLYKINKTTYEIMDPAKGYIKVKQEEFLKEWTHIILFAEKINKVPLIKSRNILKEFFINTIKNEYSFITKLLISNIIITILSIVLSYYFKTVISLTETSYISIVYLTIIIFLFFTILKLFTNYIKNKLKIILNKNIDIELIPNFLNHTFNLPLNIIKSRTSGEIITRVNEVNNIKDLISDIFITVILNFTLTIGSIYFLYNINNDLFLILLIISIIYIAVGFVFSPIINRKINNNIDLETTFNSSLSESVESLETIKNLNIIDQKEDNLVTKFSLYLKDTFNFSLFINKYQTLKDIIYDLGLFLINSYGFYLIYQNKLSLLSLITFNTLLTYYIEPIQSVINLLPKYNLVKVSLEKINEYLSISKEDLGLEESFNNGDIEINHLSYSYDKYNNLINDLNIKIPKNARITIKGRSGSGKSTLCKCLNRLIDDYQGDIKINNINIKDYSINTIRNNILYVSQREKIFSDTIKNNISLGKEINLEELNKIVNITKVNEIINKKKMRLDSYLVDSGFNLSGGEKQRIVLARALAFKPKILILDESLSEIDNENEYRILSGINKYLKDSTIIYITHKTNSYFKNIITIGA